MKFLGLFVFVVIMAACNKMEDAPEKTISHSEAILSAADSLNNAVVNNNYEVYAGLIHPVIVEKMGGMEQFKTMTERNAQGMQAARIKFVSITNGTPGRIISVNNELQTILPQTMELQLPERRSKTKTALIAISGDNGKTWRFIETINMNLEQLYAVLPNLSKELVIPPTQHDVAD